MCFFVFFVLGNSHKLGHELLLLLGVRWDGTYYCLYTLYLSILHGRNPKNPKKELQFLVLSVVFFRGFFPTAAGLWAADRAVLGEERSRLEEAWWPGVSDRMYPR